MDITYVAHHLGDIKHEFSNIEKIDEISNSHKVRIFRVMNTDVNVEC